MVQKEYELVISQGKRPLWRTALAAFFFTLSAFLLFASVYPFFHSEATEALGRAAAGSMSGLAMTFVLGVQFAHTKTVMINTDKGFLISRYAVGPFSKDVKSAIPTLEYVAVFLNAKQFFEVNLWYKGNRHYKLYAFEQRQQAFKFAHSIAKKLTLDLLDATQKGNFNWIETPAT